MKKFYAIALGALVLMAGCSKDDPEPTLPDLVVNEVSLNPTVSQIQAPAVTNIKVDVYDLIVTFENGQVLDLTPSSTTQGVYLVKKLRGNSEVIVPESFEFEGTTYKIGGWDLSAHEGVGSDVQKITIANKACNSMQGNSTEGISLKPFNNEFFTDLSNYAENLTGVFFEEAPEGTTFNLISDNGVIYRKSNSDVLTLVMVPRKYNADTRVFTVPNGVSIIGSKAFIKCDQLERVIISEDVTLIEDQAFIDNKNLIAVDITTDKAPVAYEHAFGNFARKATLRIPSGSYASYFLTNPFAEMKPNEVHPVPENAYVTYMNLDRNYFSANNTKDWTDADWENNVVEPAAPTTGVENDYIRYQNAVAAFSKYLGALQQYNTDREKWFKAAEDWKADKASEMIANAEPKHPAQELSRPTRPTKPAADASEAELDAYEAAMEEYYAANARWSENQGAIAQFKADLPFWKDAKESWQSTRAYKFFKKVQEVDFQFD